MKTGLFLTFLLLSAPSAFAAGNEPVAIDKASLDNDVTSVYGANCEKVKPGEARSTVRVRVTDKASYLAVSQLPDLKNARVELNEHDYNVMVYNLVDNNIEDMAVRTTKQTPEEICVEVTGYISGQNIFAAIDEALNRQREAPEENQPEETHSEEIVDEPVAAEAPQPPEENVESKTAVYEPDETVAPLPQPEAPVVPSLKEDAAEVVSGKGLIYIAPTEFFNNTTSAKYAEILREMFVKSDYFYITDNPELADFIINSKILRAKVDPVNSNTNRLQMVVSVESENTDNKEKETEHQNRFVLFNSADNEQKVAAKLMKQLLEKASDKIITQLEIAQRKKNNAAGLPPVITPVPTSQPRKGGR